MEEWLTCVSVGNLLLEYEQGSRQNGIEQKQEQCSFG